MRLRLLTLCAISAAKLLLCIKRRSSSRTLETKNFFRPFGSTCRVYRTLVRMCREGDEGIVKYLLVAAVTDLRVRLVLIRRERGVSAPWAWPSGP